MIYCNDTDLLRFEPTLFRDASFASQTLLRGTGDLDGSSFTLSAGSLESASIAAGDVITFDTPIDGSFTILSVDDDTTLTASVLRGRLFALDGPPLAIPIGSTAGVGFAIRTFMPQASIVSEMLERSIGIDPSGDAEDQPAILTPQALRRPCALGTLQMIYSTMSAMSGDSAALAVHADLYRRMYVRSLRSMTVEIDTDGDGVRDLCRSPGVVSLVRR